MSPFEPQEHRPHRLTVGAVLPYVKKQANESRRTWKQRDLLYALKNGRDFESKKGPAAPGLVLANYVQPPANSVLGPDVVLVPVPRSTVPEVWPPPPADWGGRQLAEALHAAGLADRVHFGLKRVRSVDRASAGAPGDRPSVAEHMTSLEADVTSLEPGSSVVVVDDLVTRGTQLIAAARTIENALGGLHVAGFAASYFSFGDHDGTGENIVCTVTWHEGNEFARCDYPGRT